MKITWLGHSCFKIESNNSTIIIDPYKDNTVDGLKPLRDKANIVLCSHEHADHNAREVISIIPKDTPFTITAIDSYHDDKQGQLRGKNLIHIISDGEYKVAHLGDLGCPLTEEQIQKLKGMDVLLIPIGGHYTIDYEQAKTIIDQTQPKTAIPMHYRGPGFGYDVIDTIKNFICCFDLVGVYTNNTMIVEECDNSVVILQLVQD